MARFIITTAAGIKSSDAMEGASKAITLMEQAKLTGITTDEHGIQCHAQRTRAGSIQVNVSHAPEHLPEEGGPRE